MRWEHTDFDYGTKREKTQFLWLPTKLLNFDIGKDETRWLEKATICQKYLGRNRGWVNLYWVD